MNKTFFDQESYKNDIDLETNADVLERIYKDNIKPSDELAIEFFFVTDSEVKAITFKSQLELKFPVYQQVQVRDYHGDFEISGKTEPIKMSLQPINEWNQLMWDFGYKFDCKLDGWQVESTS